MPRRRDLTARIERIFTASRGTYGCRRVAAELNREGRPAGVGLVADLMRELGLRACRPRAYKRTTVPGAAESFFATLKNEMYYRQRFDTRAKATFAVAEYIEIFYNRKRLHSSLGYRTPAETLADHQVRTAA